ncbi:MAG: putative hydroxymethylpyrimidine transporter CytX, partial [Lachnospiraceae bacterium]
DYTREAKRPVAATLTSVITYGFVSSWMYIIGMGAAIYAGTYDVAQIMVKAGLGIAGLLIIIFSTVTTTFLDAYSAGVSSVSVSPRINEKWAAVIVAVVGTAGAILFPMDNITSFLYLIGSVFAPMIAIQIADYFILHKEHTAKTVSVHNLIIWAAGFAIYRLLMRVDIPIGNTLPDMMITIVLCFVVNKVLTNKKE